MIMWHSVGFAPLASDQIQMLLARGLTQHLRLDKGMIDAAKALQEAGSPVIIHAGQCRGLALILSPLIPVPGRTNSTPATTIKWRDEEPWDRGTGPVPR